MDKTKQLIEARFLDLKKSGEAEELSDLDRTMTELSQLLHEESYKRQLLESVVYHAVRNGYIKLADIPRELRYRPQIHFPYYLPAYHYAETLGDGPYLLKILNIMYEDATRGVVEGELDQETYGKLIQEWLNYMSSAIIAFEGDDDVQSYIQDQERTHRDLFEAYSVREEVDDD